MFFVCFFVFFFFNDTATTEIYTLSLHDALPSSSQRSPVSARQISPRPSLAMKLIASGVANCAAIVRSPSFSRSSSSHTTTMRPARISSRASSTVANGLRLIARTAPRDYLTASSSQLLHVLGEHVHLQVDRPAGFGRAQRRALE